ncbi:T9SS sorting signal type C domain-containing protein [Flavobacterium subsaxonicum]|uniref:Secretion system C-terminal sorting domain-containing protein n=1 Tax=Flavobacterium subsaxonicum WB 4.1-42 = DSM 21790 TaxID=1121898 RepID=A0A0A2MG11_9FLAO|nr:T9SS sorting signal type C domain-containing protein [Flavobacterium subsaxonicum]KGO91617.1 hypothetical protein Q766_17290 [Flavobacterium subsaxonicum WB 4.1-42 = DSM 21790]
MSTKITLLKSALLLAAGLTQLAVFGFSKTTKSVATLTSTTIECPTGNVSDNTIICPGETATVSITGYEGTLQWQESADGESNWINVTGPNATSAAYTTPELNFSAYYRAVITNETCGELFSDVVAVTVNTVFTWVGAFSSDWNTPNNWSCGMVPTQENPVIIPGYAFHQPIITDATARARTLIVDSDAELVVATGATLKVINNLSVYDNGSVIVENNGALLQEGAYNNSGFVTIKKHSNPLYRLDYTMWSSPVQGQAIGAFSPFTSASRFYTYNGAEDEFATVQDLTASFETAKAYLIRMPNSITGGPTGPYYAGTETLTYQGAFTGTPNNGTITVDLNSAGNRYTAVGNPYPSPISLQEFFNQNQTVLDSLSGMHFWRKKNDATVSTYCTLTLAGLVANAATSDDTGEATPDYQFGGQDQAVYYNTDDDVANWMLSTGQGFFVRAKEGATGQLTFTNSMRKSATPGGNQSFFKINQNNTIAAARLWINLSGSNSFSQTAIAYIDGATTGLDYGYDGGRLSDNETAQLYTTVGQNNLAIQARPVFNANDVVALGYTANNAGQYTLALDHTDGVFAAAQDIYIKDNMLNTYHNIKEGAYSFTTEAGTFANRFEVLYQLPEDKLSTDSPLATANNVIVYQQNGAINITTGNIAMTDVTIYDISGRALYNQNNINASATAISNLTAQQQVLVVEINTAGGKVSKKIIY